MFGLDALSSAAYGPEAALTTSDPAGRGRHRLLGSHQRRHHHPADHRLFLLPADHRRVSGGRRILHCGAREPRARCRFAGRRRADDRLRSGGCRGDLGRGRRAGIGRARLAASHAGDVSGILVIITVINLRGVREAGGIFMIPTYLFMGCLLIAIVIGLAKAFSAGGHPVAGHCAARHGRRPPRPSVAWLLLKAFASGCTAMTGVEAVSNGVKAFREPTDKTRGERSPSSSRC